MIMTKSCIPDEIWSLLKPPGLAQQSRCKKPVCASVQGRVAATTKQGNAMLKMMFGHKEQ